MKQISLLGLLFLSGCSIQLHENTKLFLFCYKEDTILINGQWQSNEIYYKCDKRRLVGVSKNFGVEKQSEINTDFKINRD